MDYLLNLTHIMIQQALIGGYWLAPSNQMSGSLLTSLVAYYKMETLTTDSVGTYTLTNNNSVSSWTGKIWSAADFWATNTNKGLSRTASLPFTYSSAWSVSLWVKMNTEISTWRQEFFNLSDFGTPWAQNRIEYNYNGWTRRMEFMINSASTGQVNSNISLWTSNWHHMVMTYAGGTSWAITAYIAWSSVWWATASISWTVAVADIMSIGCLENYTSYASALIDEIWIWTKVLTAWEVTTLYNSGNWLTY